MVKFIDALTGTEMWVAEDRVEWYKAAGHTLAAETEKPSEEKKPTKRRTTKK